MVNPLPLILPNWAWDIIALVISVVLILLLIRINDILRRREAIPVYVSRKVIHIFAGPLWLITWLLFSSDMYSRYFATVVPLIFMLLFLGIGTGIMKNEEFVRTMSRSGEPRELLKGTLFYTIIMVLSSILFWFVPVDIANVPQFAIFVPTVILVFGPLAGGDGFADIIGRKWGKRKFKIFAEKSLEGTIAMFLFSFIFTSVLLGIFWLVLNPVYPTAIDPLDYLIPILLVSLVATIAELISPKGFDNLVIPIIIIVVIYLLAIIGFWPFMPMSLFPV